MPDFDGQRLEFRQGDSKHKLRICVRCECVMASSLHSQERVCQQCRSPKVPVDDVPITDVSTKEPWSLRRWLFGPLPSG